MGSQRFVFSSMRRIREYKDDFKDQHYNITRYGEIENNKNEIFPNIQSKNKTTPDKPVHHSLNDMQDYYSTLLKNHNSSPYASYLRNIMKTRNSVDKELTNQTNTNKTIKTARPYSVQFHSKRNSSMNSPTRNNSKVLQRKPKENQQEKQPNKKKYLEKNSSEIYLARLKTPWMTMKGNPLKLQHPSHVTKYLHGNPRHHVGRGITRSAPPPNLVQPQKSYRVPHVGVYVMTSQYGCHGNQSHDEALQATKLFMKHQLSPNGKSVKHESKIRKSSEKSNVVDLGVKRNNPDVSSNISDLRRNNLHGFRRNNPRSIVIKLPSSFESASYNTN